MTAQIFFKKIASKYDSKKSKMGFQLWSPSGYNVWLCLVETQVNNNVTNEDDNDESSEEDNDHSN